MRVLNDFLSVLLFDRLSARAFACIHKFMCMFLSVCMSVRPSVCPSDGNYLC